jgi:hypothetical protein
MQAGSKWYLMHLKLLIINWQITMQQLSARDCKQVVSVITEWQMMATFYKKLLNDLK